MYQKLKTVHAFGLTRTENIQMCVRGSPAGRNIFKNNSPRGVPRAQKSSNISLPPAAPRIENQQKQNFRPRGAPRAEPSSTNYDCRTSRAETCSNNLSPQTCTIPNEKEPILEHSEPTPGDPTKMPMLKKVVSTSKLLQ